MDTKRKQNETKRILLFKVKLRKMVKICRVTVKPMRN